MATVGTTSSTSSTPPPSAYAVLASRPYRRVIMSDVEDGTPFRTLNFNDALAKARAGLTRYIHIPIVSKEVLKHPVKLKPTLDEDVSVGNFKRFQAGLADLDKVSVTSTEIVEEDKANGRKRKTSSSSSKSRAKKFDFGPIVPFMDGSYAVTWNDDTVVIVDAFNKAINGKGGG